MSDPARSTDSAPAVSPPDPSNAASLRSDARAAETSGGEAALAGSGAADAHDSGRENDNENAKDNEDPKDDEAAKDNEDAMPDAAATLRPKDRAGDSVSMDGEEPATVESTADNALEISGVPPNDVKNIVLQVMGLYFDDEGGEEDAQRYDHIKAQSWIQLICDGIMEKLLAMRRPYKYVVHCMIMRKCGAGIHVCSSCYYSQADGWVNHAHDLSAHIYAVVTVYWSVI